MNGPPDCGKVELEEKILEVNEAFFLSFFDECSTCLCLSTKNGGKVVQNPGKDTHCVIAHKSNVRVTNIIK